MNNNTHKKERRLSVRGARRARPDLRRLARVVIEYAAAEAEVEAARSVTEAKDKKPGRDAA